MEAPNFIPQVIKNCEDVNQELQKFSVASKINLEHLWFDVLNVNTYIKLHFKDEARMIVGSEFAQFEKDNFYIKDGYFVSQTYDIRIKPKNRDYGLSLEVTPQADKVYILFDDGFIFIDNEGFYEEIFGVIDSLMAQNKIIFRQQNEQKEYLKNKFQELAKQPDLKKILLKQAPDFIPYKPIEINFVPKIEWEKNRGKAPQNSLFGVGEGNIVLECKKLIKGKSGRNLKGIYISMDNKDLQEIPFMVYNEHFITREEDNEKVIFKALFPGYANFEENVITFNSDFDFGTIKTINTPMLLGGLNSGITLNIKSPDEFVDAVDSNMIVEASTINIIGSIGENVVLSAKKITINGQTHQSSIINTQEAKITTHKGKCYGEKITIKNLESGIVSCDTCKIEISSGATINAKKISITTLKSNNNLYFSQKCEFKQIAGGNNKITISASADTKTKETIEFLKKKISLLKAKMLPIIKEYQYFIAKAKQNKPLVDKIKSAPEEARKKMLEESDISQAYEDFTRQIKKLQQLKKELLGFEENIALLDKNLLQIETETLEAKITAQAEWKLENEVVYHRDYPKAIDDVLIIEDGQNLDIAIDKDTKKLMVITA